MSAIGDLKMSAGRGLSIKGSIGMGWDDGETLSVEGCLDLHDNGEDMRTVALNEREQVGCVILTRR